MTLHILSGGAAQGLVDALRAEFKNATGLEISGTFGAVGAMRDASLAGAAADVLILTRPLIDTLVRDDHVRAGSPTDLGIVKTGIAVRVGTPRPIIANAGDLSAALVAADAIYFPDPILATAGIHFASVMERLGVTDLLRPRFRTFPNGQTAMRAMAVSPDQAPIGCTQVTEILNTPGVELAALLPQRFELATTYSAAVTTRAPHAAAATALIALLASPAHAPLRAQLGFQDAAV